MPDDMNAVDHLRWAVHRALEYVDDGRVDHALDSYMSDILKYRDDPREVFVLDPQRTIVNAFEQGRAAVQAAMAALDLPTAEESRADRPIWRRRA